MSSLPRVSYSSVGTSINWSQDMEGIRVLVHKWISHYRLSFWHVRSSLHINLTGEVFQLLFLVGIHKWCFLLGGNSKDSHWELRASKITAVRLRTNGKIVNFLLIRNWSHSSHRTCSIFSWEVVRWSAGGLRSYRGLENLYSYWWFTSNNLKIVSWLKLLSLKYN